MDIAELFVICICAICGTLNLFLWISDISSNKKVNHYQLSISLWCVAVIIWTFSYSKLRQSKDLLEKQIENHMKTQHIDKNA